MRFRFRSLAIAIAMMTLGPLSASADAPSKADVSRAAELKKKGDDFVRDSQFREALAAYDESYAVVPDPAILYNRGRALQQLGEFPEALEALEKFDKLASATLKSRVPNLSKTMEEITSNIATVTVHCEIEGASIVIRGKPVGTTPLSTPVRVSAGDAVIDVTKEGFAPFQRATAFPGGETTNVEVTLKRVEKRAEATLPEPDTNPPAPEEKSQAGGGWKIATFASGGVGIAAFGTGMVLFGLALADKGNADSHCPMKVCDPDGRKSLDEAQTFATASTVLVVVGVIGLATAATTLILSPKKAPVQAKLFVGPAFGGVGGTF